jgi:hypothetical protein
MYNDYEDPHPPQNTMAAYVNDPSKPLILMTLNLQTYLEEVCRNKMLHRLRAHGTTKVSACS